MSLQGPPSMHSFQLQGSSNLFASFEGREQRHPEALSTLMPMLFSFESSTNGSSDAGLAICDSFPSSLWLKA